MLFKSNGKQIEIDNYYVTNACIVQFENAEDKDIIKAFFDDLGEIDEFDIVDTTTDKITDSRSMNLKYTHYIVEDTEKIEVEYETVEEAWDEESIDEETEEPITIHHDAVVRRIENKIPVEMTSVFLEVPTVEMSISSVKSQIKTFKSIVPNTVQFQSFINIQCEMLTDEQALLVSDFFEAWDDIPDGTELKEGKRLRYKVNGLLYKVKTGQTHKKQSDWNPKDAASLFEVIEPNHAGTKEDPIPAHVNMEYFKDKYYVENEVIYLCNSVLAQNGVVLQYVPSQLVGIYFEIVE
ncbi:hypothetical protein H9X90_04875 [Faecalicatena contorta]|uniref:hypothetical protein n=1 Tax=Faecalicatena contorta TaxID=39482 RepID=UPI00195FA21C|nr:hypothetical protein [Faecalicatena contorta]MBM6686917.1 hypothetical protein [Faecalicatena contorta]MBM6710085.1 hypothetical protein [Faecalicatena contorta]